MKLRKSVLQMAGCTAIAFIGVLGPINGIAQTERYWSGSGNSDNISDGGNWYSPGQPSCGDNLNFNSTSGSHHWVFNDYGCQYFGNFIQYNGAGYIRLYGNTTYLYKFENNNEGNLLEAATTISSRTGPDSDLEINPVGSGGVAVTNVIIQNGKQLKVYGNNILTLNGVVSQSGSGNATLNILGTATVVVKTPATYLGDTYINNGTLRLSADNALTSTGNFVRVGDTSGSASANLNLDGGLGLTTSINIRSGSSGTKTIANTSSTSGIANFSGNLYLDADATLYANNSGTVLFSGSTLDLKNQTLTVDGPGVTSLTGSITNSTGNGKLIKNGSGTLIVSGANTNSGATTLNAGKTIAASGSAFGNGAITCAATLEISNATINASSLTLNNGAILSGSGGVSAKYSKSSSPSIAGGATVTLSTLGSTDQLEIGSAIQGGDSSSVIIVTGPGTNLISSGSAASGAYSGSWRVTGGTLRLSHTNALGNPSNNGGRSIELVGGTLETRVSAGGSFAAATIISGNSTITPGRGSSGTGVTNSFGTLSINASQLTITPGINVNGGSTAEVDFTTGTLTGNATLNVNSGSVNSAIVFSGGIGESGGSRILFKSGSGQLVLNGKSTYSGGTTISTGTLFVNGGSTGDLSSGTGSGNVSVSSGATLGGTGRIAGNVTFNSGALALFTNGSTLTIAGSLTLNGNVVHLNLPSNLGAGTYTLATYNPTGSSGTFNSTPTIDSGTFASGTTNYITTSGGTVNLVVQNTTTTMLTRTTGTTPSTYGDSLTFQAAVSPDPGNGSTVTFLTNGVAFGTATTTSGTASLTTTTLPFSGGSPYTVTASFAGSANYTASSGTLSGGQQVNARSVSLMGTRAYDGTTNAASAILSVANAVGADTVNVASGTGGLADKNVGTQSITSFGTLSLGNNSAGNYTLASASGSVVITQAVTAVAVSSSENPSGYKDSVTFTATLPSDATGDVIFKTNSVALSTNPLSTGVAASSATAALARGNTTVTAEYAGDSNYLGSTNDLSGGQSVTNHPPAAMLMTVQRTAGLTLKIALADVVTNWSDADDDSVTLSSLNLLTTNGVNLSTNGTWIFYTNSPNVNDQISYSIGDSAGGSTTGLIRVLIVTTVTGTNSIASVVHNENSTSLTAYGIPGLIYVTQRSTNLIDWVSIATNTAATNGVITVTDNFTDLNSTPPESAYYRLSWSPQP